MRNAAESAGAAERTAPAAPDHFAALGLPRRLGVDAAALKRAFHALSRAHHPDLVHHKGAEARAEAAAAATRINDAFNCLKDRIRRVEHLLALEGRALESRTDAIPPRFFDLVFAVNAAAQEAKAAGGRDAEAARRLAALDAEVEAEEARQTARLAEAERAWDAAEEGRADAAERGARADALLAVLKELLYLRRLRTTLRSAREAAEFP